MTQRELLELAALDALGLLDEFEAAYYTRSFHDAPATVQDEIKRIQAELTADQRLLPGDEPDPGLRERVLKAVAQAIERDESRLAPLATIGRRRTGEHRRGGRFHLRASGQFWRAACFVVAGVAVVFALFWVQAQNYVNALSEIAYIDDTECVLEDLIGPTFKDYLFDPETTLVRLMPDQSRTVWPRPAAAPTPCRSRKRTNPGDCIGSAPRAGPRASRLAPCRWRRWRPRSGGSWTPRGW
jgi:hypothetical protein